MYLLLFLDSLASISWVTFVREYAGFIAYFAIFGALGYSLLLWRRAPPAATLNGADPLAATSSDALRYAAYIGLAGASLLLIRLGFTTVLNAGKANTGVVDAALNAGPRLFFAPLVFGVLLAVGFALAVRRTRGAWAVTAVVAAAFALRYVATGHWENQLSHVHKAAASLWLGTLFVLVVAGLPAILRAPAEEGTRGPAVAGLFGRFSTLALAAAALVGLSGVVMSWLHLKYVAALWTTPYGYALIAKLAAVGFVAALGAWNWRRLTPRLGADEAAHALRRSATKELVFAGVVLLFTAALLSVPAPKLPAP